MFHKVCPSGIIIVLDVTSDVSNLFFSIKWVLSINRAYEYWVSESNQSSFIQLTNNRYHLHIIYLKDTIKI